MHVGCPLPHELNNAHETLHEVRVAVHRVLLQFDQTKEDKQLVLDDPDEWANTEYFPFDAVEENDYSSSSLLSPISG